MGMSVLGVTRSSRRSKERRRCFIILRRRWLSSNFIKVSGVRDGMTGRDGRDGPSLPTKINRRWRLLLPRKDGRQSMADYFAYGNRLGALLAVRASFPYPLLTQTDQPHHRWHCVCPRLAQ